MIKEYIERRLVEPVQFNYFCWKLKIGLLGIQASSRKKNLTLPFKCAKNVFCKSSLGFQGTLSRVVKFHSTEVNIIQGCIVNGENKNHFTNSNLFFFCASLYLYLFGFLGGKHRWNLLYWQWSPVWHLLSYFETFQPYLWRLEPFGFHDHVRYLKVSLI